MALPWKTPPLARRAELLGTIALPWKAAAAGMVDRLSPIDRRLKTEWPLRKAAEKTADAAAGASGRAIGDNGSTMEDDSDKRLLDRS
jgi:hypothetical protein